MVTLRSALYHINDMLDEDLDSMDATIEHKKQLQKEIHHKVTSSHSYDSSSSSESELGQEHGFVNNLECGIDPRVGELQPFTPSPKRDNLMDFNSPANSSLSSHLSDSFVSPKMQILKKTTKW